MGEEQTADQQPEPQLGETMISLNRYHAGDQSAFAGLFERYRPAMEILIRRNIAAVMNPGVRRRLSPDDVLQDAMETVIGKLKEFRYRGPGSLLAWMMAIAAHKVSDRMDYWEREKRRVGRERALSGTVDDSQALAFEPPDTGLGPSQRLEQQEQREILMTTMASLPERDCRIVMLHFYYDATWDEIAKEVGARSGDVVRAETAQLLSRLAPRLSSLSP